MKHVDTLPLFSQAVSLFDLDLDHDKILKRMKKLEYREAAVKRGKIMVEKTFAGNDYRILNSLGNLFSNSFGRFSKKRGETGNPVI